MMKKTTIYMIAVCIAGAFTSIRAQGPPRASEIRDRVHRELPRALDDYRAFLRLPNDGHFPEQMQINVDWVHERFASLGFASEVLVSDGVPHVFAERRVEGAQATVLFYLQIDGQPVDTSAWDQSSPFEPALKQSRDAAWEEVPWERLKTDYDPDYRVFARSASDSKGPAICFLTALKLMNEAAWTSDYHIKVIADFQEEMGSPTLSPLVENNRDRFAADVMLIMDGTRHLSNLPTLTFGARGLATMRLTVYGAERNLHSGQYGNFAPNPVFKLSRLLAGMKDEQGRVIIPGYYEGVVLSESEKALINDVPEQLEEIKASLGIAEADAVGATYQEALQYPSLNVRGLRAAWVWGGVRTIIPNTAVAELDLRLVPETPGERQVALIRDYIRKSGYHIVADEPTRDERLQYANLIRVNHRVGSKPFRTDMQSDLGLWLESALKRLYGAQYVKMRTTGGSQPIAPFINTLGVPAVSVRIPNPDNNIHAPNENLRVGNFSEGIETCLSILTQPWQHDR
ncbi:MAG: M20/M25/M40 family metallo-hydrolase [Bacteroidota bacterium]